MKTTTPDPEPPPSIRPAPDEGPGADRPYRAISDYALLSDCHGSALVARDGSIDWCCLQRFDACPVFGRLLDRRRGGFFRLGPPVGDEAVAVSRRYLPGTMVLETRFETASGALVLTDFMVVTRHEERESQGHHPETEDRLIRIAWCEGGEVDLAVEFAPRFNYGITVPHLKLEGEGQVQAFGGADALVLQTSCSLEASDSGSAIGQTRLAAGETARFVVSYLLPHALHPIRLSDREVDDRLTATRDFWSGWSARCEYDGDYSGIVGRSALVLKALSAPMGSIVAAPTTSLPEWVGGQRNWDYRYTWLRDAGFVLDALFLLGYRDEGEAFIRWLYRTVAAVPEELQIMYGAGGEPLLPEHAIPEIEGYRRSSPVRVGNAAARQFQLDIYGDVLHVAWRHVAHGGVIEPEMWRILERLADYVGTVWDRPDSGLWEVRSRPRHFVHSKVMAWVALDRAVRLAEARGARAAAAKWSSVKETIRARVLEKGVSRETGGFKRAYDLDEPDAATLLFPLTGFIRPDDERARATTAWVQAELSSDGFLRRYVGEDGLDDDEGCFLACSFWLIENLAWYGQLGRARELFERVVACANDVGLLSEQIDPRDRSMLGNFPQALSHIGLINAAVTLDAAARGELRGRQEAPGIGDERTPNDQRSGGDG